MGRSYSFECPRCGYRAVVSGRADQGLDFFVQTIVCKDCKELYDVLTRMRIADSQATLQRSGLLARTGVPRRPPTFRAALSRLPLAGVHRSRWVQFPLQCPVSPSHRVQRWNEPAKCPHCAVYLEKNALPYRIWD
jgi:hypothetical protein